jgi:hypothetical protein
MDAFAERPWLLALLVLIGGFVGGVILISLGFTLIGIVVGLGAIPVALGAWMMAGERF